MTKPQTTDGEQLRKHNEYDSLLTEALMREHSADWSMETIREAALICSNTMLPLIAQRYQQRLAAVLEALPKSIRIRSSPKTEDQKMRAMWDRGHNNALDECRAAITATLTPDTEKE